MKTFGFGLRAMRKYPEVRSASLLFSYPTVVQTELQLYLVPTEPEQWFSLKNYKKK